MSGDDAERATPMLRGCVKYGGAVVGGGLLAEPRPADHLARGHHRTD